MEVIIDTNVIMDAVFDQLDHEDCWQILHLVRKGEITPVVSEGLSREYIFVPAKIVLNAISSKLQDNELKQNDIEESKTLLYQCCTDIAKIILNNSKVAKVTSNNKYSVDPSDDKIINLAIDSNCTLIITSNTKHFECVEEKHIKTKSGKEIEVYTPDQFVSNYRLIQHYLKSKNIR
jgi:predicted nucleic acid-binding protein